MFNDSGRSQIFTPPRRRAGSGSAASAAHISRLRRYVPDPALRRGGAVCEGAIKLLIVFLFVVAGYCGDASASEPVKATAAISVGKDRDAVVAELFTSQSCSSCPAAQAFLGDLARRTDVIALELHVDYWDQYKTLFAGSWKDPFSSPTWTQRQADYNRLIMGNDNVYTPQMIIDGQLQDTGSRRGSINSMIEQAKNLRPGHYSVTPKISPKGDAAVTVDGPGLSKPVRVILALLQKDAQTDVTAGENKGNKQVSHNVVREMLVIGTWDGGKQAYKVSVPPLKDDESCAVILQDPETMHILSGGVCGL